MKPILFSTPMVQAILAGRKTQTRRAVKVTGNFAPETYRIVGNTHNPDNPLGLIYVGGIHRPRYHPGDILWVRETWCHLYDLDDDDQCILGTGKYYYLADNPVKFPYNHFLRDDGTYRDYPAWRPSIHMPRAAARLFLRVTNVRVERINDISDEDACAEGCADANGYPICPGNKGATLPHTAIQAYMWLWNDINSKRGHIWANNPWVWVYEFECDKNGGAGDAGENMPDMHASEKV